MVETDIPEDGQEILQEIRDLLQDIRDTLTELVAFAEAAAAPPGPTGS